MINVGVALIVGHDVAQEVRNYNTKTAEIMLIRFHGTHINITIIKVYAPTT